MGGSLAMGSTQERVKRRTLQRVTGGSLILVGLAVFWVCLHTSMLMDSKVLFILGMLGGAVFVRIGFSGLFPRLKTPSQEALQPLLEEPALQQTQPPRSKESMD